MDSSPKTGWPIQHVQLLMEDGRIVQGAHWAYGDGDGMMPPFGPAWFVPVKRSDGTIASYQEVSGAVRGWAPIA